MKHKLGIISGPFQVQTNALSMCIPQKNIALINELSDAQFDSTVKHELGTINGPSQTRCTFNALTMCIPQN